MEETKTPIDININVPRDSSTPPTTLQQSVFSKKSQSLLLIIGVILIFLLASSIGLYFFQQQNSKKNKRINTQIPITSQPTTIRVTSNPLEHVWENGTQVYSNPKLGFTFEYPNDFLIGNTEGRQENLVAFFSNPPPPESSDFTNVMSMGVYKYPNPKNLTIMEFLESIYTGTVGGGQGKTPMISYVKDNLSKSQYPILGTLIFTGSDGGHYVKRVFFIYKDAIYEFSLSGGEGAGSIYSPDAEKVFDKSIKSIKFN